MKTSFEICGTLPLDIASTVLNAIGAAYPNASIDTQGGGSYLFKVFIDDEDRDGARERLEEAEVEVTPREESDIVLGSSKSGISLGLPKEIGESFAEVAKSALTAADSATMSCASADGERFTITFARD